MPATQAPPHPCLANAADPADPAPRHLRAANDALKRDVTGSLHGEEALVGLGFRIRQLTSPLPGSYYVFPVRAHAPSAACA